MAKGKRNPVQCHLGCTIRRQIIADKRQAIRAEIARKDKDMHL